MPLVSGKGGSEMVLQYGISTFATVRVSLGLKLWVTSGRTRFCDSATLVFGKAVWPWLELKPRGLRPLLKQIWPPNLDLLTVIYCGHRPRNHSCSYNYCPLVAPFVGWFYWWNSVACHYYHYWAQKVCVVHWRGRGQWSWSVDRTIDLWVRGTLKRISAANWEMCEHK